ncbi:response regulator transcription factor [Streptomyces sp. KL118A]|uniref:response regulator transcription factor n=1 Tax=Streptomyces sp. KL118A TaxID=3045153 RepID=UPI00278C5827|nr:LuxR C-terminal-related transcriptional regulator [Streptomyces sp. KL118A]
MPAVTAFPMSAAHDGRSPTVRPSALRRRARLRRALWASGRATSGSDAVETACLVWLAGVLVEIAAAADDARTARVLVDEASATLAALPDGAPRPTGAPRSAGPAGAALLTAPLTVPLTQRELVVLRELRENVPLRGIAENLHVSLNTVRSQTRSVYRKLGVGSRAQALHRARELGLL